MTPTMPPSLFRERSASRETTWRTTSFRRRPNDRDQRAWIIGEWLQTEARFAQSCPR